MGTLSIYEKFKEYAVPAKSVEDFCNRYHRRDAYHDRGTNYMAFDLSEHTKEFNRNGMTFIPSHDSATGNIVAYYGDKEQKNG